MNHFNIYKITDEELNNLKDEIEFEKTRRKNKRLQRAQEEFREIIEKYKQEGICFRVSDGYGDGELITAKDTFAIERL